MRRSHSGQFPASSPRIRLSSPRAPRRPWMWVSWSPDVSQGHRKALSGARDRESKACAPAAGVYAGREEGHGLLGEAQEEQRGGQEIPREAPPHDAALEGRLAALLERTLCSGGLSCGRSSIALASCPPRGGTRTLPTLL